MKGRRRSDNLPLRLFICRRCLMGKEDIPPGFELQTRRSGLTDPWQPIYARRTDLEVIPGFRGAAAQANSRGFFHGGLISSLADNAMG